jgi:uncharacterized membrane protein YfcA
MHLLIAGALAFVAGVVFGIFGAGGSILLVPILVYALGVPVKSALGMSLLILMLTGGFATAAHSRSRYVSWWIGLRWALVGMIGAYAGGRVAEFIPGSVLLLIFATVVVVVSLIMIRRATPASHADPRRIPMTKVAGVAIVLGFFTGMIGVGGGFLLVPVLVLVCGIDVKLAIGTSLLIITINSLGGFLGFVSHEPIPWRLALTVAAFNAAGSLLGERLGKPLPAYRLRPAFGVFLLVVGAAMVVENLVDLFAKSH